MIDYKELQSKGKIISNQTRSEKESAQPRSQSERDLQSLIGQPTARLKREESSYTIEGNPVWSFVGRRVRDRRANWWSKLDGAWERERESGQINCLLTKLRKERDQIDHLQLKWEIERIDRRECKWLYRLRSKWERDTVNSSSSTKVWESASESPSIQNDIDKIRATNQMREKARASTERERN